MSLGFRIVLGLKFTGVGYKFAGTLSISWMASERMVYNELI